MDARDVERDAALECDLCIVGAGAAGITLAREFVGTSTSVCLLESGGFDPEPDTQALCEGVARGTVLPEDSPYLSESRLRCFGGTTHVWAGYCRPLDPIDFESRSWVPHSGWPFSRSHLEPYYRRASPILQIAPFDYAARERSDATHPPLLPDDADVVTRFFHYSPPTRFGELYRDELLDARNVTTILHANAVDISTNAEASRVAAIAVASLSGNRFRVHARHYVLAAGGIENARLLLLSNSVQRPGLGNGRDLVGRFFMEHPVLAVARAVVTTPKPSLDLYDFHDDAALGHQVLGVLSVSEREQRRKRLLNLRARLRARPVGDVEPLFDAVGQTTSRLHDLHTHAHQESDARGSATPGYFIAEVSGEQAPNPDSRVSLAESSDALGRRRANLNWQLSRTDNLSLRRSMATFGRELGRHFRGRVQIAINDQNPWPDAWGPHHHMGTTRMHDDPAQGVVDANARVHGVENLHIAGSSVFPTCGFANPTYTIVALTLRLADHLKREVAA
jgi:choline dehydrogenase-like flavoprotein